MVESLRSFTETPASVGSHSGTAMGFGFWPDDREYAKRPTRRDRRVILTTARQSARPRVRRSSNGSRPSARYAIVFRTDGSESGTNVLPVPWSDRCGARVPFPDLLAVPEPVVA